MLKQNKVLYLIVAGLALFFLIGFSLQMIGFFSSVSTEGLRRTICGIEGCTDMAYLRDLLVTLGIIAIPIAILLFLVYTGFRVFSKK